MQIETLPIADVHPDPANARRHSQRNLDAIKASLARFGQQKPVVIDANNVVRAGNGTLAAAEALGWTELRIVRTELLGIEATAFAIADNRTAELAEWDPDILAAALADPAIGDLGFDEDPPEPPAEESPVPIDLAETWQVVAECANESQQQELFDRLTKEGFACRLLTL
jgi:hypothetical protein